MRTNIVIDPKLIGEALRLSGAPTKRQVDHDHKPVASLNTIAPDGPNHPPLATAYLPSGSDSADSEMIP